jgi:hypothetical protein
MRFEFLWCFSGFAWNMNTSCTLFIFRTIIYLKSINRNNSLKLLFMGFFNESHKSLKILIVILSCLAFCFISVIVFYSLVSFTIIAKHLKGFYEASLQKSPITCKFREDLDPSILFFLNQFKRKSNSISPLLMLTLYFTYLHNIIGFYFSIYTFALFGSLWYSVKLLRATTKKKKYKYS